MPIALNDTAAAGRLIAAGRMLAGWDQGRLAQAARVSSSTVSNVERGSDSRDDTIKALRRALRQQGVTLAFDKTNGLAVAALSFEAPEDDDE